jgi:hypothetical protein
VPTQQELVDAVEKFFRGVDRSYGTWTMEEGGREMRVLTIRDCPSRNFDTVVAFDGVMVEWPEVVDNVRLLPIMVVVGADEETRSDAGFHVAWLLDRAIANGVPPRPREIVLSMGHSETLPHARFDHPLPWEQDEPAQISVGELTIIPVLAYSVSESEAKYQLEHGSDALEKLFEDEGVAVFYRDRPPATGANAND